MLHRALLVLLISGCVMPPPPPPRSGVALSHEWGPLFNTTRVWKDGREVYSGVFTIGVAAAVRDAVTGLPSARDEADTAHTLAIASIPTGLAGAAALIGGALLVAGNQQLTNVNGVSRTEVLNEDKRNLGIGVAVTGGAMILGAGIMNLMSTMKVGTAVRRFNGERDPRGAGLAVMPAVVGRQGGGAIATLRF